MAIGFWTSGSAANAETRNPSGARNPAAASAGESGRVADGSVFRGVGKSSAADAELIVNARRTQGE